MKKISIILILLLGFLYSCEDLLDKEPLDGMSDAAMWGGEATVQGYVDAAYVAVTLMWNHPTLFRSIPWGVFYSEGTDEAFSHLAGIGGGSYIATGDLTPSTSLNLSSWGRWYYYIQHINTFFDKYDEGVLTGSESLVNRWRGEMHFIRAWAYSMLVNSYGGVVLTKTAYTSEDLEIDDVRASYEDCVEFIIGDLDAAIELLPETVDTDERGKATKGIAMALKARQLLYAASELHNPDHDNDKWQAASDAALAVINSGYYSLYSPDNYNDIFFDFVSEGNTESILVRHMTGEIGLGFWYNFPTTMFGPVSWGSWGIGAPTQSMVDEFELADGTPYDRAVHGQNPYEGREPRFYANILYDGAEFSSTIPRVPSVDEIGTKIQTGRYIYEEGDTILGYDRYGGALKEAGNATRTGYYLKKFVWEDADEVFEKDHMQVILIRLSEMYLNYAECQMELGNPGVARDYIVPLRERVGLPTPASITMADIRHERKVELAFEGNRFWDVRRWKILDETMVDQEKVELVIDYTKDPVEYHFDYVLLQERNYNEAYYYLPIPASEIEKNPNLDQNPFYN